MAFISVIMVGYNAEAYLHRALRCLLAQKYQDYEFVFVNNGSTDSTASIIESFHKNHPEICMKVGRVAVNDGLPNGRNVGLSLATGQYVMFHDVDDWMDTDCLEVLAHTACLNSPKRIIQQVRMVDETGKELEILRYPENASRWSKYMLQGDLFLREVITENGLYFEKEAFYDDFYFVCRFNSVTKNAWFINETYYNMCMHEHSLTHRVGANLGYYPSCLEKTFRALADIWGKLFDEYEKRLYEYSCIQMYYYLVFHSVEMTFLQKVSEYESLNKIMNTYYPLYLKNPNVKLCMPNGFRGHFKRNIWICNKAEKIDKVFHFPFIMILILFIYHIALRLRLYKYKA